MNYAVRITKDNPALADLKLSWNTAVFSDEDGLAPLDSLHQAGDAMVAVSRLDREGAIVIGSGVMVGPGLMLTATHVLDEFPQDGEGPVCLTFLPNGARAWLPISVASVSRPNQFDETRHVQSDMSLISCTLNSKAHADLPLMLAPMKVAQPLIGERLWAVGYRHQLIKRGAAHITPFVSSGLVTAAFPNGRGEWMPSPCFEVAMETLGGMSGGAVMNADGDLVGIVTVDELEREIGGPLSGLDRGDATLLPRLAAMTRTDVSELAALVPADLATHPMRPGPKPPHCWAVCRACLEEDQIQGRAPYVRRAWTHPLSVFCRAHNTPFSPHGNSDIKIATDLTLFGDGAEPIEPRDSLLSAAQFDDPEILARVFRMLDDSGGAETLERRLRLRWAVRDVIDALRTNMRAPNSGVLSSLLESPLFQRRSPTGSNHMPQDCWADLEAATRLLYARLALLVLAEPDDPVLSEKISPLGRNWLLFRYRHTKIKGWQALFEHAAQDLMFLLPMELPRNAILQLDERSLAWPQDLRRRWTYAAAAGAIGGYVY